MLFAVASLPAPAKAHSCATPAAIEPNKAGSFEVGVAAEEAPVVGVDVLIPAGFRLDEVGDVPGWTSARDGDVVHYTGGEITPFQCGYFRLGGTPTRKATLVFAVTTHMADGTVAEYASRDPQDFYAAQLLYAGTDPPNRDTDHEGGGPRPEVLVTGVALAAVTGAAFYARSRSARPAQKGRRR